MKKSKLLLWGCALAAVLAMAACSSSQSGSPAQSAAPQTGTTSQQAAGSSSDVVMTAAELAQYNGKNGQPAYVAVDGVIYDVTDVPEWAGGEHNGLEAGQDLTEQIKNDSPHGLSVLKGLPVVGRLEG